MTKDADFSGLVERLGPPPQIIWLTCGNTSEAALRGLLRHSLPRALQLLAEGESLVEISSDWTLFPPFKSQSSGFRPPSRRMPHAVCRLLPPPYASRYLDHSVLLAA